MLKTFNTYLTLDYPFMKVSAWEQDMINFLFSYKELNLYAILQRS
jgi:hypothetical protein